MPKVKTVIDKVSPHTIKKFELVEEYVKPWAQKLMLNNFCSTLVFIDCMCNCGIYLDDTGKKIEGTSVRVAKSLLDVARMYPNKKVELYLNDIDAAKIAELKKHIPNDERNYTIITSSTDASDFLKTIGPQLYQAGNLHYFLFYDPYDAHIDWAALLPFFRNWGEVLINHMVSDPVRAITTAKKSTTKEKYENTYLADFEKLVPYGSDKQAYEKRVMQIIEILKGERNYFVSAFPFHNTQNSQVYSLVHCTSNEEGFKLYKKSAWKVFGGHSSTKHMHDDQIQLVMDLDSQDVGSLTVKTDESCYGVVDIAKYLAQAFSKQKDVPLNELWKTLDRHPIFPSDGFRPEIKKDLINIFGATQKTVQNPATGKREYRFSFS